jgi:hypothetical protein
MVKRNPRPTTTSQLDMFGALTDPQVASKPAVLEKVAWPGYAGMGGHAVLSGISQLR